MKYTAKDVKESIPEIKKKTDSIWSKCGARELSYYLAAFFLNIGFTPNMVSVISIIDAVLSAILMSMNNLVCVIIGFFLLDIFVLIDCIDGNMARTLKKASYMGEFYDAVGGYSVDAFTLLAVGICTYNYGRVWLVNDLFFLVIASAIGTICQLFARLIYQKYTANELIANYKLGRPLIRENDSFYEVKPNFSFSYIRMAIDREIGTAGFYPPLIILGFIFNFLDIVILGYLLYYIVAFLAVTYIYCRKATGFDKSVSNE